MGGFWGGFWNSFQREFLNLMSFGYLDDSGGGDDAGVFAQVGTEIGGGNVDGNAAASETAATAAAREDVVGASRGVGNVFTYVTSPWAVMCLFMVCQACFRFRPEPCPVFVPSC